MNIRKIIREELEKVLNENTDPIDDIDLSPMMSLVNQYPDLVKYFRTPLPAHRFWINHDETLVDNNGILLPKYLIECAEVVEYSPGETRHTGNYVWTIDKTDSTPGGRQRDKTTHKSDDINKIAKTANRLIKNLIAKSKQ